VIAIAPAILPEVTSSQKSGSAKRDLGVGRLSSHLLDPRLGPIPVYPTIHAKPVCWFSICQNWSRSARSWAKCWHN